LRYIPSLLLCQIFDEEVMMVCHMRASTRHTAGLLLLLLLIGLVSLTLPQTSRAADSTRVYAVLKANPGIMVARGGVLRYIVQVENVGEDDAAFTRVRFSYDDDHITLSGSEFAAPDKDWVTDVESRDITREQVLVTFGDLNPGETRTATLLFEVNNNLEDNTVINSFASFNWTDGSGDRSTDMSNSVPVLVGGGDIHTEFAWLGAEPDTVPQGNTLIFFSNRYLPEEPVVFWLNLPDGTQADVDGRERVNDNGVFEFAYDTGDLPPGTYQMVAFGLRSELVGFATFTVQ
jgi:hypothetical protein